MYESLNHPTWGPYFFPLSKRGAVIKHDFAVVQHSLSLLHTTIDNHYMSTGNNAPPHACNGGTETYPAYGVQYTALINTALVELMA